MVVRQRESHPTSCHLVMLSDITQQKGAEQALREREAHYRVLFTSMTEAVCIVEVQLDPAQRAADYRLLDHNPAFELLTQAGKGTSGSMDGFVLAHKACWLEACGSVALTGKPVHFHGENIGVARWYDISAYRLGDPETRKVALLFSGRQRGQANRGSIAPYRGKAGTTREGADNGTAANQRGIAQREGFLGKSDRTGARPDSGY